MFNKYLMRMRFPAFIIIFVHVSLNGDYINSSFNNCQSPGKPSKLGNIRNKKTLNFLR